MTFDITLSFGDAPEVATLYILPEECWADNRRKLKITIGKLPADRGDGVRQDIVQQISSVAHLRPPIELVLISTENSLWTDTLASAIQREIPDTVQRVEVRITDGGVPGFERSLVYFPGECLSETPTYSSVSICLNDLVTNGRRNPAMFQKIQTMHSHLRTLYLIPPWDLDAFSEQKTQIIDELILVLSSLDGLDDLYLPPDLFDTEDWEDICSAFTDKGNVVPSIMWW